MTTTLPHGELFALKWTEWLYYRSELKKPYKTTIGVTKALNKLGAMSEKEAISMINNSMEQEYQGLFPVSKTPFDKQETPKLLSHPKVQKISQEPAKYFDPKDGKAFIISKIKKAFEGNCTLNDVGSVYTSRLKRFLEIDPMALDMIRKEVQEIANRKPKNRFEEVPEINVELEIRNRILSYNMDRWREENRKIWKEL